MTSHSDQSETPSRQLEPNSQAALQSFLNAVATTLQQAGRDDLLARLKEAVDARREAAPSLVVVGETKTGKSSLVNALLRRPSLSPVNVDIATCCTLVFYYAESDRAQVRLASTGELRDIPLDEIGMWATTDGNPNNQRGVHAVVVGLNSELLQHMTIVDTPGLGGLDASHSTFAMEAVAAADAVVVTMKATAPVSAPEINVLATTAGLIDSVTLVLTHSYDHQGWKVIADDNKRRVAEKLPRLSEGGVYPVSSTRALNPGKRDGSGIGSLESRLTEEVAGRADTLRYANILRVAFSCVDEVGRDLQAKALGLSGNEGALAALQTQRDRLNQLHSDPRRLMQDLDEGLRELSLDRADALSRSMRDLRLEFDHRSNQTTGDALDLLPGQLLAEVTAAADRLSTEASDRIAGLIEQLIGEIDAVVPELATLGHLYSADLEEGIDLGGPRRRVANRVERLSTIISFSSGRSIGTLVASLPVIALGGLPFMVAGLGLGAAFAWNMHKGKGDISRQADFRTWMREQLAEAERQLNNDFSRAMLKVSKELKKELAERIDDRRNEVGEQIRMCDAAINAERGVRDKELRLVDGRLHHLRGLYQQGGSLRSQILGLPAAPLGRE